MAKQRKPAQDGGAPKIPNGLLAVFLIALGLIAVVVFTNFAFA